MNADDLWSVLGDRLPAFGFLEVAASKLIFLEVAGLCISVAEELIILLRSIELVNWCLP